MPRNCGHDWISSCLIRRNGRRYRPPPHPSRGTDMAATRSRGPSQLRIIPDSLLTLEAGLERAIEQAHFSTDCLQLRMAGLQQQLQQRTCELEKWKTTCSQLETDVDKWKAEFGKLKQNVQVLEGLLKTESRKRERIGCVQEKLEDENTDLRRNLEKSNQELSTWKEDCMYFAMKFLNWAPALLKCGPALDLQQELRRKKQQFQRKKGLPARVVKSRANMSYLCNRNSSCRSLSIVDRPSNSSFPAA